MKNTGENFTTQKKFSWAGWSARENMNFNRNNLHTSKTRQANISIKNLISSKRT